MDPQNAGIRLAFRKMESDWRFLLDRLIRKPSPKTVHLFRRSLRKLGAALRLFPECSSRTKKTRKWIQEYLKRSRKTRNIDVLENLFRQNRLPKKALPSRRKQARKLILFLEKTQHQSRRNLSVAINAIFSEKDLSPIPDKKTFIEATNGHVKKLLILLPTFIHSHRLNPGKLHQQRISLKIIQNQWSLIGPTEGGTDPDETEQALSSALENTLHLIGKICDLDTMEKAFPVQSGIPGLSLFLQSVPRQKKQLARKLLRTLKKAKGPPVETNGRNPERAPLPTG